VHPPDPPAPPGAGLRRLALREVVDLSAGWCAITTGGRVLCLQGDRWRPVPGLRNVVEVACGDTHTCARTGTGAVYCWGEWYFGPAHHDGDESDVVRVARPRRIAGLTARAITSWEERDFAVGVDGALWMWGRRVNKSLVPERSEPPSGLIDFVRAPWWECRQSADGTARCENTVIPAGAPPFELTEVAGVSVSERGGCAVHRDGRVSCWGRGPVGDGTRADRPAPVVIPDLADVVQVSVAEHACALSADGTVRCWGDNREGELGDGTTRDRLRPTVVDLAALQGHVVGVVALGDATAVWTDLGEAWTWGAPW
jgi:alpha-tubulin suppressor-like RCC1 family protein